MHANLYLTSSICKGISVCFRLKAHSWSLIQLISFPESMWAPRPGSDREGGISCKWTSKGQRLPANLCFAYANHVIKSPSARLCQEYRLNSISPGQKYAQVLQNHTAAVLSRLRRHTPGNCNKRLPFWMVLSTFLNILLDLLMHLVWLLSTVLFWEMDNQLLHPQCCSVKFVYQYEFRELVRIQEFRI